MRADRWYSEWDDEDHSDGEADDDGVGARAKNDGEAAEAAARDTRDDYDDEKEEDESAETAFARNLEALAVTVMSTAEQGLEGRRPPLKAAYACGEILLAVRSAGLDATRIRSLSRRTWLIKVRAPEWRLELEAEKVRLRLRRVDGGWSKFRRSMRAAFVTRTDEASTSIFHSSDRQTLINHILRSATREGGADLGDASPLGAFVDDMFPLHMRSRLSELRNDLLAPWRPSRSFAEQDRVGEVQAAWYAPPVLIDVATAAAHARVSSRRSTSPEAPSPVDATSVRADGKDATADAAADRCCRCSSPRLPPLLARLLVALSSFFLFRALWTVCTLAQKCARSVARLATSIVSMPLDRIAAYFGETIAFQFAWTQFYTRWLVAPALAGIGLFLAQLYYGTVETPYSPLLTLAMALWSMLFLAVWKRRTAELAARWGVLGYEAEEGQRPAFVGRWVANAATGEVSRIYSRSRRALTYALTVPATIMAVFSLVAMLVLVFSARDNVLAAYSRVAGVRILRDAFLSDPTTSLRVAPGGDLSPLPPPPEPVVVSVVMREAWARGLASFINAPPRAWRPTDGENSALGFSSAQLNAAREAGFYSLIEDSAIAEETPADPTRSALSWTPMSLGAVPALNWHVVTSYFSARGDVYWWIAMTAPPLALGIIMPLLDAAFSRVALMMNDMENHETESDYRNARIGKVFLFRFTAAFISLFWYAFSPSQSLIQLAVQLGVYLVFGQWWSMLLEAAIPSARRRFADWALQRRVRSAEDSGLTEGRRGRRLMQHALSSAWVEARLPQYDSFDDYSSALIQLGHVTFFAWAFPLAPAVALVFNVLAMRANAFKLVNSQRPIASKASGIGIWLSVLESMALAAVLVNCAQLALVSRAINLYLPGGISASARLLLIFVVEHAVLALRLVLPVLLPPIPERVRQRLAKDDFSLMKLQLGRAAMQQANHGSIGELTGGHAVTGLK